MSSVINILNGEENEKNGFDYRWGGIHRVIIS